LCVCYACVYLRMRVRLHVCMFACVFMWCLWVCVEVRDVWMLVRVRECLCRR